MSDRFASGAKVLLMLFAVLLPLWFMPGMANIEIGREIIFSLLLAGALILWLLSILTTGELKYSSSLVLYGGIFLLIAFGLSTFFSKALLVSLIFGDPSVERFSTMIMGVLFMILASSLLRSIGDVKRVLVLLVLGSGVAGVINFLQLAFGYAPWSYVSALAGSSDFNVVGTVNGLALFFVSVFVLGLGLIFSSALSHGKSWIRFSLFASLAVFLLNLLLIHFQTAWIVLLGSITVFFGLMFMYMRMGSSKSKEKMESTDERRKRGLNWRYSVIIFLIAFSVVMLTIRTSVLTTVTLPTEVSPTFATTWNIAMSVFKEGGKSLVFGSGPATFNIDWPRYKDIQINQTAFWSVTFGQGSSWFSTIIPTSGLLGVFAFLFFIGLSLFLGLRHLLRYPKEENAPLEMTVFIGFVSTILIAFLYPATLTSVLLFFFLNGMLLSLLGRPAPVRSSVMAEKVTTMKFEESSTIEDKINELEAKVDRHENSELGWFDIAAKTVQFESAGMVFLSSLLAIFFLSLAVASSYLQVGRMRAEMITEHARDVFGSGNVDEAIKQLERVTAMEDRDFHGYAFLSQARTEKIRSLIQRAVSGQNVQQEFQSTVSLAIQDSQRALALNPQNSTLWRTQGSLYEMLIPFIPGSEKFSFDSYRKAIELEPLNPAIYVDLARAGLVSTDRMVVAINQAKGSDKDALMQVRVKALEDIMEVLKRAVDAKSDFAAAHFLSTQTAIRLGNLPAAIQSAEKAKISAPFDIGVAFQLGLLYYQNGNADAAQQEFERAVSINENYSNARYFLGLIYDHKGDKDKAINQFERIASLNADNQEIKIILVNLKAGKTALAGIVPPGAPPEKRTDTPVKEEKTKPAEGVKK